jgi:hypothetical protein
MLHADNARGRGISEFNTGINRQCTSVAARNIP